MRRSLNSARNGTRFSKPVIGAAVSGIVALLLAALLNANAFAASRFLDDSTRFAEAESALVTTQLSLRTLSQAVLLAEDVDLGVADAATAGDALGEARRVITELERQVDTLGIDPSDETRALSMARGVIAALERGDTTEAGVLLASDTLESYKALRDSIAVARDDSAAVLTNARSLARQLGTIAGFLVALLAPAAAVFAYWRIARRQLGRAHVEIDARLRAEKKVLEAKDEFIANVSHELRTPLTSIYGFSEFLVENGIIDPAEALSLITVINGESAELNRMVEDLLTSARSEAETIAYNCVAIDIAEEAATVVKPFGRMGLTVEIDCAHEQVWADQLRTRQILRNLLSNAQRWGGQNVRVTSERIGANVAITVADDGPGVPEMVATRLFTRYVHEGSDPLTKGSVGLGLAVVKILTGGMGGTISYDRVDGWSRFTLTLPAADPDTRVAVIGTATTAKDRPAAVDEARIS